MAFHGLCHAEAEVATARATAAEGTIFCASTVSNCSLEAIAAASGAGPRWFQLYVYRDREITRGLVERAAAAGYTALCLTVDTPLAGHRERDKRNTLRMPSHLELGNFPASHSDQNRIGSGHGSALAQYIAAEWDPALSWKDVEWLRSISPMPVVVKGVLAPQDAVLAIEHGAAAVIVSNHGGRQLDTVPAAATMLVVPRCSPTAESAAVRTSSRRSPSGHAPFWWGDPCCGGSRSTAPTECAPCSNIYAPSSTWRWRSPGVRMSAISRVT
jgi:isopentenyl diphosphate isomerase/L-lactate dehydrogenase-like FMN-dependent dehydrogenase